MIIAKAKRLTEALVKSDALGIPRSNIIFTTVSDGIELYAIEETK